MRKILLAAATLLGIVSAANATTSISQKAVGATGFNLDLGYDGTNYWGATLIYDGTNFATVNANTGLNENVLGIGVGAALDGWNATEGTTADAAWSGSGNGTEVSIWKYIAAKLNSINTNTGGPLPAGTAAIGSILPFAPGASYASLAAGASSANVALPTGATVAVENMGANAACVKLGTSNAVTATSSGALCTNSDYIPAGQTASYTVGANTYLAAIDTSAGTTNLMLSGGAGSFAGGGGGGGSGGSAVSGLNPGALGTPIAATFAGVTGSLPAGVVVVATNVGATYGAYCNLGASTSTSAQYIAPNGGWFAFGNPTGSATQITCQTPASGNTTTVNLVGGSGSPGGTAGAGPFTFALGTTNGWTPQLLNALTNTKVQVKSSAGEAGMLQCYNPNTSQMYVQIFGLPSASVTVGSTTPALSIPIPPSGTGGWALGNFGVNFASGITVAATTTATGSTAPGTALDCNMVYN